MVPQLERYQEGSANFPRIIFLQVEEIFIQKCVMKMSAFSNQGRQRMIEQFFISFVPFTSIQAKSKIISF